MADDVPSEASAQFVAVLVPAIAIGLIFIVVFLWLRLRIPEVYAPRTRVQTLSCENNAGDQENKKFLPPHGYRARPILTGWSWPLQLFRITDTEVLASAGVDALMYIRAAKIGAWTMAISILYGFVVLMPVYHTDSGGADRENLDKLDKITIGNLAEKSDRLWAPLISVVITTFTACYFLRKNTIEFARLSTLHRGRNAVENYTVLVQAIPENLRNERVLQDYYETKFDCRAVRIAMAHDVHTLQELLDKHAKSRTKLITFERDVAAGGDSPVVKSYKCCGKSEDAIEKYTDKTRQLWTDICDEFKEKREVAPVAFVTFESNVDANMIASCSNFDFDDYNDESAEMVIRMAPQPSDVFWKFVGVRPEIRRTGYWTSLGALALLIFTWTIPVAFINSLSNLATLGEVLPFLSTVTDASPALKAFLQGFLPTVGLLAFMALLPNILRGIGLLRFPLTNSELDRTVVLRYYLCLVLMVFLVTTIQGSILNSIQDLSDGFTAVTQKLAESLPTQATFFAGFITLQAMTSLPKLLLSPVPLLKFYLFRRHEKKIEKQAKKKGMWEHIGEGVGKVFTLHRKLRKSTSEDSKVIRDDQADEEKRHSRKKSSSVRIEVAGEESIADEDSKAKLSPKSRERTESKATDLEEEMELVLPPQDQILPETLLVFTIATTYSAIAPFVILWALLYFLVQIQVLKYNLLFVWGKRWELGGAWWPYVFNRFIVGLLIFQLTTIGSLLLKKGVIQAAVMIPNILCVLMFAYWTNRNFNRYFRYLAPMRAKQIETDLRKELKLAEGSEVDYGSVDDPINPYLTPALKYGEQFADTDDFKQKLGQKSIIRQAGEHFISPRY